MMVAHARAVKLFKDGISKEKLVLYMHCQSNIRSDPSNPEDVRAAEFRDIIHNKFILDANIFR